MTTPAPPDAPQSGADKIRESCDTYDGQGVVMALDNLHDYAKSLESTVARLEKERDGAVEFEMSFEDWMEKGSSVYAEKPELSTGDFHSGTVFSGLIRLDPEQLEELRDAMKRGYTPTFRLFALAAPRSARSGEGAKDG